MKKRECLDFFSLLFFLKNIISFNKRKEEAWSRSPKTQKHALVNFVEVEVRLFGAKAKPSICALLICFFTVQPFSQKPSLHFLSLQLNSVRLLSASQSQRKKLPPLNLMLDSSTVVLRFSISSHIISTFQAFLSPLLPLLEFHQWPPHPPPPPRPTPRISRSSMSMANASMKLRTSPRLRSRD